MMEWFLAIGGAVGAWVVLLILSGERQRRLCDLQLAERQRRMQLERQRKIEASIPTAVEI